MYTYTPYIHLFAGLSNPLIVEICLGDSFVWEDSNPDITSHIEHVKKVFFYII